MNKDSKKTSYGRRELLTRFLKGSGRFFVFSIIFSIVAAIFDLISPRIVGYAVDILVNSEEVSMTSDLKRFIALEFGSFEDGEAFLRQHIYVMAIIVILLAAAGALFKYLYNLFNSKGAETLVKTMRDSLFQHIEMLKFSWYSENHTGDIIQRCTSDVETVKSFLSEQLTGIFRTVIMIGISLYFMFGINIRLAIIPALFVPLIFLYSLLFHEKIGSIFLTADEEEGVLSTIAQENLTGVRVVRAFGRESHERDRFSKQNDIYTKAFLKLSLFISYFWSLGDLISEVQVMIIVVLGSVFCIRGDISTGDFVAFVSYDLMLSWPVRSLGRVVSDMSKAWVSVDRIGYIMNSEEEEYVPCESKERVHGDIIFENVTFSYSDETPDILKDLSFTIPEGSTFGILGSTGSGKSTITYLIDRLYDLGDGRGRILIGGRDIKDIPREVMRRSIGLVLQEPFLFSRTIEENIAIAIDDASGDAAGEVRNAADTAQLDGAIRQFTKGYDTVVGERGVTLSGGQKQRTAIAGMLVRHTPVMIFDDSLSAVDSETDMKIRNALADKMKDATVIIISHRISTLMDADKIIVLKDGKVAEEGNHKSLMEMGGIYSRVCEIQSTAGRDE